MGDADTKPSTQSRGHLASPRGRQLWAGEATLGCCKVRVKCRWPGIPGPLTALCLTPISGTHSPGHILGTDLEESRDAIRGTPEYLDKVAFKHHGVRKQVEFWRVNHLAEQSLLHTQAHSRVWFSIHRQEAPEFFPGIRERKR